MADIMLAYGGPEGEPIWRRILEDIWHSHPYSDLPTRAAIWRVNGERYPVAYESERVYIVYNRLVRGYAPLVGFQGCDGGRLFRVMADLSQWQPCGLEWPWGPDFRFGWRYVRFTRPCLTDFPGWHSDPGLPVSTMGDRAAQRELAGVQA